MYKQFIFSVCSKVESSIANINKCIEWTFCNLTLEYYFMLFVLGFSHKNKSAKELKRKCVLRDVCVLKMADANIL